ncbi:DUF1269 domain-containing protein [Aeromicrobium chenweiae]|uniref:Uncharacterized protein n=1 Tax=Aeromicrobium chenweiae TaxID=2079793 RepID=A0A2S0WM78_9ACTN|nr:DUF1269 domain-containing protein [Aeromicrobium chenweiae]AWB92459.1 hypothetical protein C3E78_09735 [Aeromicrobium chenweiae]TGN31250.1 DUF1269 domain-containing protein [Aeromicrobium chenweiae]
MTDRHYSLLVAAYDDQSAAREDFKALKSVDDLDVVAAVVLSRNAEGTVEAREHGGKLIRYGTAAGAVAGVVVGLFAPSLLLSGVIGAGVGAGVGEIVKRHEEKQIGVDAQEWLPAGSSAVVAVVEDVYLDRVDEAFEKASKSIAKALNKGDYDAVVKAVNKGEHTIVEAIAS